MKNIRFDTAFNSYSTIRVIGEGGSGIVYEVSDDDSARYALKLLSKNQVSREKAKRFKNEINFCSKETHKNIIRVIDSGFLTDDKIKRPFYVMPLYRETLRDLINKKITPVDVLPLFAQILDGVEAAHLLKIWHRDIKPENILYDPSSNQIVIADFGIAHFNKEELLTNIDTKPDSRLANFQYAAPEQRRRGALVDHRADIFALGLIFNEMFTGEVLHGDGYKRISDISLEFSYLDEIVSSMVQQSPEARLASIQSIKQQLIAKKNDFISLQRVDNLKKTVIPNFQVSDPLLENPLELIGFDTNLESFQFDLNQTPPNKWVEIFVNRYEHDGLIGAMPSDYRFKGNRAYLSANANLQYPSSVQLIIDRFKYYAARTNEEYKNLIISESKNRERQFKEQLQKQLEAEEARQKKREQILSQIKL